MNKKELTEASARLMPCPFCSGKAEFVTNKQGLLIVHYPESGVNCPARFEQYCDNFVMGMSWWNKRC